MRDYAVYALYKGDDFLMIGTADEIAQKEGVKRKTVLYWASPAYKKKIGKSEKCKVVIRVEEDNDE